MPVDLVLIRHGRSEGDKAREQCKQGDNSLRQSGLRACLDRDWRRTDLGIAHSSLATNSFS